MILLQNLERVINISELADVTSIVMKMNYSLLLGAKFISHINAHKSTKVNKFTPVLGTHLHRAFYSLF